MRTKEELRKAYIEDTDYHNLIIQDGTNAAIYILLSHLEDNLKILNKKLENINSLLDGSN